MRFASIGTSSIVELFDEALGHVEGARHTVVHSRDLARGQQYADQHATGARVVTDLDELAQAPDVDAVYVASPNAFHHEQVKRLLKGGKHVLVEKSACTNEAQWREVVLLARDARLVVVESVRAVFAPSWPVIASNVESLGPVRQVAFQMCQRSRRYDNYLAGHVENIFKPEMAAGALMDLGVYCLHPLVTLFGAPERVQASSAKLSNGIDAATTLLLDYPGFTATVACSKVSANRSGNVVAGEDGTLWLDSISDPRTMRIEAARSDGGETHDIAQPRPQQAYVVEAFQQMCANPSLAKPHQRATFDALRIMDEARRQVGLRFPGDA